MCTGKFSLLEMHMFQHTVNPTCRVETRSETGFGWSVALEDLDRQTGSRVYALSTRVPHLALSCFPKFPDSNSTKALHNVRRWGCCGSR